MPVTERVQSTVITTGPMVESTAPRRTSIPLGNVLLSNVALYIPNGHAGLTGFQVQWNDVVIVPWELAGGILVGTKWVQGNDHDFTFPVGVEVTKNLTVLTYNSDVLNHSHYIRFTYTPISLVSKVATIAAIPISTGAQ